jgi:hypothetical protein
MSYLFQLPAPTPVLCQNVQQARVQEVDEFPPIKAGYAGVSRRANDKEVIVPAGPSVEDVL